MFQLLCPGSSTTSSCLHPVSVVYRFSPRLEMTSSARSGQSFRYYPSPLTRFRLLVPFTPIGFIKKSCFYFLLIRDRSPCLLLRSMHRDICQCLPGLAFFLQRQYDPKYIIAVAFIGFTEMKTCFLRNRNSTFRTVDLFPSSVLTVVASPLSPFQALRCFKPEHLLPYWDCSRSGDGFWPGWSAPTWRVHD